jgi:septal ring factor EnvC (AmiA/AmiB activator)
VSRDKDIANLRNRLHASRTAGGYASRCFVDVPTHVLERLLDALTAAEAELDQARHDAAHHRERLARMEAKLAEVERERAEARAGWNMTIRERDKSCACRDAAVARAERMRSVLIECLRATPGCFCSDEVSDDFLAALPQDLRWQFKNHRA